MIKKNYLIDALQNSINYKKDSNLNKYFHWVIFSFVTKLIKNGYKLHWFYKTLHVLGTTLEFGKMHKGTCM